MDPMGMEKSNKKGQLIIVIQCRSDRCAMLDANKFQTNMLYANMIPL